MLIVTWLVPNKFFIAQTAKKGYLYKKQYVFLGTTVCVFV